MHLLSGMSAGQHEYGRNSTNGIADTDFGHMHFAGTPWGPWQRTLRQGFQTFEITPQIGESQEV